MKKIILSVAFILLTGTIFGQTLSKDAVLALRIYNFELLPGATNEQVENYLTKQSIDFNNSFDDIKLYMIKGLRGENENKLAGILYMPSDDVRNKYFTNDPGGVTEAGQLLLKKFQETVTGLQKFVTTESAAQFATSTNYTDWEIH
jgi:hypothetical protein